MHHPAFAFTLNGAGRGLVEAGKKIQQRGLTAPGRTDNRNEFSMLHLEERYLQAAGDDHRNARCDEAAGEGSSSLSLVTPANTWDYGELFEGAIDPYSNNADDNHLHDEDVCSKSVSSPSQRNLNHRGQRSFRPLQQQPTHARGYAKCRDDLRHYGRQRDVCQLQAFPSRSLLRLSNRS